MARPMAQKTLCLSTTEFLCKGGEDVGGLPCRLNGLIYNTAKKRLFPLMVKRKSGIDRRLSIMGLRLHLHLHRRKSLVPDCFFFLRLYAWVYRFALSMWAPSDPRIRHNTQGSSSPPRTRSTPSEEVVHSSVDSPRSELSLPPAFNYFGRQITHFVFEIGTT